MNTPDEVTHIAQTLAATDLGTDLEWVVNYWHELNQTAYIVEASKLITVIDALAAFRAPQHQVSADPLTRLMGHLSSGPAIIFPDTPPPSTSGQQHGMKPETTYLHGESRDIP